MTVCLVTPRVSLDVGTIWAFESRSQVDRVASPDGTIRQREGPFVGALALKRPYVPRVLGMEQSRVDLCAHRW